MNEAELVKQYKQMRLELVKLLEDAFTERADYSYVHNEASIFYDVTDKATIPQLWRLYRLTLFRTEFTYLPCNPTDYLAISMGGMYVGIETDGYMHS